MTENMNGGIKNTDLTGRCDIHSQSGEEYLRTALTRLTSSENFEELKYVDVGFPIPFLQVITKLAISFKLLSERYIQNILSSILHSILDNIFLRLQKKHVIIA